MANLFEVAENLSGWLLDSYRVYTGYSHPADEGPSDNPWYLMWVIPFDFKFRKGLACFSITDSITGEGTDSDPNVTGIYFGTSLTGESATAITTAEDGPAHASGYQGVSQSAIDPEAILPAGTVVILTCDVASDTTVNDVFASIVVEPVKGY